MGRFTLWIRNSPIITNFTNTPTASSSFSIISLELCPLSLYSCYQFLVLSSWLFNWVGGGEVTVLFSFNTKGASNIWKRLNGTFWWMYESIYFRHSSLIRTHSPVFHCSCWLYFIIFFEEEIKLIIWKTNSARASKPLWTGYERSLFFL